MKTVRIGDLGKVITGHTPPTKDRECYGDAYPLLKPTDMRLEERYSPPTEESVSEKWVALKHKTLIPRHATCVVTIGTIGKICIASRPCFTNQAVNAVIPNTSLYDEMYVYYLLRTVVPQVKHLSSGTASGRENVSKSAFSNIEVSVPEKQTQRKIASILSAYDDLIENNTRRIAILEEIAQAIYREWFVNFRFPGHENVKLIDSPLGKIPEGWEALTLESVLTFYIGGGWGKEAEEEGFTKRGAVIRGTDIPSAKHMNVSTCPTRFHQESNIRSRRLENGDIVFEVSGGSKGQPVGRSVFVSDRLLNCFEDDVICASFCKLIRPNSDILCSPLFFHYLLEAYTNGIIEQYEVQSTGIKNFKFTEFLAREHITVPPTEIQRQFLMQFEAMQSQIEILGKKTSNLRTTRDLLLPKLISGQLDVEDLEIDVGMTAEELTEAAAG